jgi:polyisoprenoid-binding protein YceI
MKKLLLIIILLPFISKSQTLKIQYDAVSVKFKTNIKNAAGTIGGFGATIQFDIHNLAQSKIEGKVSVKTLNTGISLRDKHLKSADYFDEKKHPFITYKSISITKSGAEYMLLGKLKIKQIEREEQLTFSFTNNVFRGEMLISASNYDLGDFTKKGPEKTKVWISFEIPIKA